MIRQSDDDKRHTDLTSVKPLRCKPERNTVLWANRGIGFEPMVIAIEEDALAEGMPCQTPIASIPHKVVAGRLPERPMEPYRATPPAKAKRRPKA